MCLIYLNRHSYTVGKNFFLSSMYMDPQLYLLTISPPYRLGIAPNQYRTNGFMYNDDKDKIIRILRRSCRNFQLWPEFDISGRLHYHGWISIHDMIKWKSTSTRQIRETLGFFKVDRMRGNSVERATEYARKEWEETKQILQIESPICPIKVSRKKPNNTNLGRQQELIAHPPNILDLLNMQPEPEGFRVDNDGWGVI